MPPLHVVHAAPVGQPDRVAQIAARLFPAYTVDGGRVRLAGCTLDERLFARLECRVDGAPAAAWVDADGCPLAAGREAALGLLETTPLAAPAPTAQPLLARFLAHALPAVPGRVWPARNVESAELTAVWCRFAEGKLRFTIGTAAVDVSFADWARTLQPPPFVCPHSGASSFHLAALDDGRIVAAEQIAVCEVSGGRLLLKDTTVCAATGKRVRSSLTSVCPVCGDHVLSDHLVSCGKCGQAVSPTTIKHDRCRACRRLQAVHKDEPRMARLLHENPLLDRLRAWRLGETASVYILESTGWLRRVLAVVDKHTLELRRVALSHRFSAHWEVVAPAQYPHVFRK